MKDPVLKDVWTMAFGKEFGGLAQGDKKIGTQGSNTLFVMTHHEIDNIPRDQTITYGQIVIDYRPQKSNTNCIRITVGGNGNPIDYPGELTTHTTDLTTAKILWNSFVSTRGAKYMCINLKNFYLHSNLDHYKYMRIPLSIFPTHIIEQYNMQQQTKGGFFYLEI